MKSMIYFRRSLVGQNIRINPIMTMFFDDMPAGDDAQPTADAPAEENAAPAEGEATPEAPAEGAPEAPAAE